MSWSARRTSLFAVTDGNPAELTDRQRALLDFERDAWTFDEPKEHGIRARFGCSPDEYYAELNRVLDHPAALSHDPLGVRRLRRFRDRRRRARLEGGPGVAGSQGGANA